MEQKVEQKKEADGIIRTHVLWSMGGGFVPIPLLDVAAVTAVQLDMLKRLATLYEVDYSATKGKAFASALTGSSFARIAATAIKRIPGAGSVIGGISMSVLSGASTYAVGKVAVQVMGSGGDLSEEIAESAGSSYQDWLERGKRYVKGLARTSQGAADIFQSLEKLKELQEKGVLTQEEFESKKQELLARV